MTALPKPVLDGRDAIELVSEFRSRRAGYLPRWSPPANSAGAAIEQIFARLIETILKRLNQAPEKNRLAFYSFLGLDAVPAQEARAPIVFQLNPQSGDTNAPPGTQVAAPPPTGQTAPIVFETEHGLDISAATIVAAASLWPGRDEYVDHSAALAAAQPFVLFDHRIRQGTPHTLYLAHSTLLAMTGASTLVVEFELAQGSDTALGLDWEYWDGAIWRAFKSLQPTCLDAESLDNDGTAGLTKTGSITLVSDSAKTAQLAVNGSSSFWIRARLTQTLPANPARILPVVESLKVRTKIQQPLSLAVESTLLASSSLPTGAFAVVLDPRRSFLAADKLILTAVDQSTTPSTVVFSPITTASVPVLRSADVPAAGAEYDLSLYYLGMTKPEQSAATRVVWQSSTGTPNEFGIFVKLQGLSPDKVFSGQLAVDVTKTFFPFSAQPQPGSALYFTHKDIFAKPNAKVQLFVQRASTPQDNFAVTGSTALRHTVAWEYWNGAEWTALAVGSQQTSTDINHGSPTDLDGTGLVSFTVPTDFESTQVANQDGLWIRVRLVSGGFGFDATTTIPTTPATTVKYIIPQPPALSEFRLGFTWGQGPEPFEQVFTYNDFVYEDHTEDALWPGKTFAPFMPVSDQTAAFYMGTDKPLPSADAGIFFDILEQAGLAEIPPLVWEEWDGGGWRELSFEDDTQQLHLPGVVMLQPLPTTQKLEHFGQYLYWIRARLKEDLPPDETQVNRILPNAVWARQQRTFQDLALGTSTGAPSQLFNMTQIPILADERIEVREYAGKRAEVEWRILALRLFNQDPAVIEELELQLAAEGPATEIVMGDLRLVRDRSKRVTEVWVRWIPVLHFYASGSDDRNYQLDHFRGRLLFGDGNNGAIPPLGAAILARTFRSGGGSAGNLPAGTIKQLLGAVSGVQAVSNPRSAEGGADGELLSDFAVQAPERLRARERAISARDYETLAREASASVAYVRAIPGLDPSGRAAPGWVTLLILPESLDPRPEPSFGLREEVRLYLENYAPADIAASHQIFVTRPEFFPVDISATLITAQRQDPGAVSASATAALQAFLHPLTGGPVGQGWDLGRDVYLSDISAVLSGVAGVDAIAMLALLANGIPQGDSVSVSSRRIVVAGTINLKMIES